MLKSFHLPSHLEVCLKEFSVFDKHKQQFHCPFVDFSKENRCNCGGGWKAAVHSHFRVHFTP